MGFVGLRLEQLKALLAAVHSGQLPCPLSPDALACQGFQDVSEQILASLRGLEQNAVRAVLVAVIAERLSAFDKPMGSA
ncbi:MAG: hypothetical protein VX405_12340 [Myxococcota bacterium]|nr:hypothetical protein [Myxococcota bacterium]